MDTRMVAGNSSAHQEAIEFFTQVLKEKLQDQSIVDVKYVQPHLGQANENIQALLRVSYKKNVLSFFLDHPEAFAVYGQNVSLAKNTQSPTREAPTPSRTSKMPPMDTEIESNFAEEAAIGFVAGAVRYRGPLNLDRLAGQCSRMSSEMQDFLSRQKGTSAVKRLGDLLASRPHIFDISSGRTVSVISKLPCIKEAEVKGLESMCRCLIGPKHMHLDTLLKRLQQQSNHLLHMVLNEVSQDGLEEFLLTRRVRFFMPELQDVWNISAFERLPLEMERKIVKFFKQEITCRGEGIHYVDLLREFEKSDVVMETKFNHSVQLAKILWCHESELDFVEGIVLAVYKEPDDTLGEMCPPACRQDASQKVFRLYGSWLADYKGVISFASKHTMLIQATVEDCDGVEETFEVYCHCKFCVVGNGTDPKADLCQFLRKGDEVIFSAIYDDSESLEDPNKPLWSAVRVTKVSSERPEPDPPYQHSPVKNPAQECVEKQDKRVSQPTVEKTSLEHVSDDASHTLQAFGLTGIVTIVGKNCGVLQIDRPSGTKNVYFELSKVETDVSSGLCKIEVGQRVQVEVENGEQSLPEATRVRLIPNLHGPSQNGAAPSGTGKPLAAVKPSHTSQVEDRPVTPKSVEVAAITRNSPSLYSAVDDVMISSHTSSQESLAASLNSDIGLNHLNMSSMENAVLNVFSIGGQTMPNLGVLPQDIQNRLVALIAKELLAIAANDPVFSRAHRNSDCQTAENGLMVSVACQTLSTGPVSEALFPDI